jgi:hypothetical protein
VGLTAEWALIPKSRQFKANKIAPTSGRPVSKISASIEALPYSTAPDGRFAHLKPIFLNSESGLRRLVVTKMGPPLPFLGEMAAIVSQAKPNESRP